MGNTTISGPGEIFGSEIVSVFGSVAALQQDDVPGFMDVMKQVKTQAGYSVVSGSTKTEAVENGLESGAYRCRRDTVKESSRPYTAEDQKSAVDKLDSYAKDVNETLKEELSVTDEQIEDAMEKLGVTYLDLLNPNALAGLAAELAGCEDAGALLCSGEFLQAVQTIGELSEELLGELGLTKEELQQMFDAAQEGTENLNTGAADGLEDLKTEEQISRDNAAASGIVKPAGMDAEEIPGEVLEDAAEMQKPVNGSGKVKPDTDSQAQEAQDIAKTSEPLMDTDSKMSQTGEDSEQNPGHSAANDKPQSGSADAAVPHQNVRETVYVPNTGETVIYKEQVDVSNIIRQIVSFSKVHVAAETATMEMQLNPEHLGKLYLEVTAKEGSVSAHIMAQNEAVREALESQITDLKQSLNQAGVRVDAVEVTVGNHEFERNLEQNAKQQEQQAEEQEKSKNRNRRINLNNLDELSGIMTEEETLAAQIMADQGNSVDYTA